MPRYSTNCTAALAAVLMTFGIPGARDGLAADAPANGGCALSANLQGAGGYQWLNFRTDSDPWAPLTPGFWLSYGAVALLQDFALAAVERRS